MVKVGDFAYFLEEDVPNGHHPLLVPGRKYLVTASANIGGDTSRLDGFQLQGLEGRYFIDRGCGYLSRGNWRFTSYEEELKKILE